MAKKKADKVEGLPPQPPKENKPAGSTQVGILARLVSGNPPANQDEKTLLYRWNCLTKLERYALAAEWNLPFTGQARDDRLAGQAKTKLG